MNTQTDARPAETGVSAITLKKILAPIDFSAATPKVVAYAARFAEQFGAQLVLLHVNYPMIDLGPPEAFAFDRGEVEETMRRDALAKLTQWKDQIATSGAGAAIPVEPVVRRGVPHHEIVQAARELEIDLIVIATHGYTGMKHLLLGSTAERVVRHALCPVLVVREREHDFV